MEKMFKNFELSSFTENQMPRREISNVKILKVKILLDTFLSPLYILLLVILF